MTKKRKIRYAMVGVGNIAQVAVLPAFQHARENSELAAFFSDDPGKGKALQRKYGLQPSQAYRYGDFERGLAEQRIDAVYIALPNSLHREYTVRAARAGVHVLCEKPMAVTEADCRAMIEAAEENRVKLMIAYRLHFERSNLEAVQLLASGRLGEIRIFNSVFSMQLREGDIRSRRALGGGTLYDIGVYCINAARYLFRAEPVEVAAFSTGQRDARSREVDEMTGALLRFPGGRIATFVSSFGAADSDFYQVLGTKGSLKVVNGYGYTEKVIHEIQVGGKTRTKKYPTRDQFAPELVYFSNAILNHREVEPSGHEGLIDVQIVRALYESARTGRPVTLKTAAKKRRPTLRQEIHKQAIRKPKTISAPSPSK
jgi:predicted dehydrogenase